MIRKCKSCNEYLNITGEREKEGMRSVIMTCENPDCDERYKVVFGDWFPLRPRYIPYNERTKK